MSTAPTREHRFRGFGTSLSFNFHGFLVILLVSFRYIWDRFRKPFWFVLGSGFAARLGQPTRPASQDRHVDLVHVGA